jgi:3-isopropylmalate/(R)-2-methylmalate dehydratase small subunit
MRRMGIAAIVAESFSDLFFRNCVNYAMPALPCPGVTGQVAEGDVVEVDLEAGTLRVPARNVTLAGTPMPATLIEVIGLGGLIPRLRAQGYIA